MRTERRSAIRKIMATFAGIAGFKITAQAKAPDNPEKESIDIKNFQDVPLFAGSTRLGNLVFISGTGPDDASVHEIRKDTDFALRKMEKRLIEAGSSMDKVLKVTVFLNDIADFQAMNEVYKGRFGKNPPARSTIAAAKGGIPGNSIIEIDCIAYI